ncbi:hypothetical protein SAMN05661008_00359 [Alkalithermobacter thermoalcaliphilus JW-YL-7 = DSM 7308]|uniref:Transporter n=1 Tax=Alkalithermobacter thermoalcaliphilus JW-YL-7 = DSM 7308 TaxID=1121328 RepID=A0A150FQH5_CLOPD|nr:hypothetical protein JWYL7_0530 [[Clostridium] paradoxum JW-YL-7 = DSM 7308]SHK51022.1 hypothetical protein SAMN05661008_00359 [[Clostridium] paradoxum JW-YL-7 = DSM 7308]
MLTGVHYIYILFILIVLVTMALKRDTIIPCILGIFCISLYASKDIAFSVGTIFNSFIVATKELIGIILIISIIVSLSKALEEIKATQLIVTPFIKVIKNRTSAFFSVGIVMLILAWFFWPSPATALVGAIFLPIAVKAGLPAIGVAMAINLFGHGLALSTDFVIQGAPTITASAAGVGVIDIIKEGMILYWTMAITSIGIAYYMLERDIRKGKIRVQTDIQDVESQTYTKEAKISAFIVPLGFLIDIVLMFMLDLKGGEATALIGGTAIILLMAICFINYKKDCLEKITSFIQGGFGFGIDVFSPIIPIAAFFYLGQLGPFVDSLGAGYLPETSQGILSDIGLALSNAIPMNKFMVCSIESTVGAITGLDGSGFSGISLAGSLAKVFGEAVKVNVAALAALGQITAIWVGGGTIVPWGLIPAAAICKVSPMELAKRNFIPVVIGMIVTTIVAMFIL